MLVSPSSVLAGSPGCFPLTVLLRIGTSYLGQKVIAFSEELRDAVYVNKINSVDDLTSMVLSM